MSNTLNLGSGDWATKDNSLLGYNSENGNFKPLPFNFSRGSIATVINKQGLIETVQANNARVDYLDNAKGALLFEPSRTNLITQSEAFDNSYWTKSGATVVGGFASPSADSPLGAFKLVEGTSNSIHRVGRATFTANVERTLSVFAKKGERDYISLFENNYPAGIIGVIFNLNNGTHYNTNPAYYSNVKIELISNGWYKCSVTMTNGGLQVPSIGVSADGLTNSYTGDGTSGIYIFGAQLEEASYPTSYINTQGTAQTRLADVCSQTPPDGVIGQTEGSIFIELDVNSRVLSSSWAFSLNDGTTSNYIGLRRSGGAEFFAHINVSGTTTALISTGITNGKNKISIGYASNDIIVYVNGVNVGGDTSSNIPTTSDLQIGNLISNRTLEDSVSGFKLYNTRLSNSELAALTTI